MSAQLFSIIADEATDSANEQLSISVRFVEDGILCEKFLSVVLVLQVRPLLVTFFHTSVIDSYIHNL